jgi:predicted acyltransferase
LAGQTFQPVLHGFTIVLIFWLVLFWMYRRKLFLKI